MSDSNQKKFTLTKPTIGRKVWFWPNGSKLTTSGPLDVFDEKQALDATVVCVFGDRMVNLSVTDHGGRVHSVRSCTLRQEGDEVPGGGYCEWMPYQVNQAKTSALIADTAGGLNFGAAIESLKIGLRVARSGWNGKGMYLWLMPTATVKAEWCKEPHLKFLAEQAGGEIEALGTIRMLTADGKILTGWLASQSDMLAEDWVIVQSR